MIDLDNLNKLDPARGRLLISEPFLEDPNFKRSVILLCEHNEEGSFGFVLNRAMELKVSDFMEDFPDIDANVGLGGPVKNNALFYLHTAGDRLEDSVEIMDGLYMGGSFETMKNMLESGDISPDEIRFFVGYSGWGSGQLEEEMKLRSWIVVKSSVDVIMNATSENAWGDILTAMGKEYSMLANFPEDPSLN